MNVFRKVICISQFSFGLLVFQPDAGDTAVQLGSLKGGARDSIVRNLGKEGYMARFENGQGVKRGVSAYLWDNRNMLKNVDFHNARQTDVLICVMIRKGYGNFSDYAGDREFMDWCSGMLK